MQHADDAAITLDEDTYKRLTAYRDAIARATGETVTLNEALRRLLALDDQPPAEH